MSKDLLDNFKRKALFYENNVAKIEMRKYENTLLSIEYDSFNACWELYNHLSTSPEAKSVERLELYLETLLSGPVKICPGRDIILLERFEEAYKNEIKSLLEVVKAGEL